MITIVNGSDAWFVVTTATEGQFMVIIHGLLTGQHYLRCTVQPALRRYYFCIDPQNPYGFAWVRLNGSWQAFLCMVE